MKLTVLGSGTCVPTIERSSQSNFIEILNKKILVDCGPGTLRQIVKGGFSYKDIDIICISHYHNDHVGDLNAIMQALNRTPGFDREKDLLLVGPKGFSDYCDKYISLKTRPNTFNISIKEIDNIIDFGDFKIETYNTIHCKESIAYKFVSNNKSLVITGDTDYDEGLIDFVKQVSLLIIECSFTNNEKAVGHLISKECGYIGQKAGVDKMVLNHIYPTSTPEQRLKECKEYFKNTILAEDLLEIKI